VKKHLILSLIALFSPLYLAAQVANNTSLVGTVTDTTGAAIAGASVSAIGEDTKVVYKATTNPEGYYNITGNIIPGTYDVVVDEKGFQKLKKIGVIVVLNEAARTDFALKPGAETQEVSVSASTPAIQTDDPLLGETVSQEMVADLPNSTTGRNALEVANIASNVAVGTGSALTGVPPGVTANGAGTRGVNNSITLDGITTQNNLGSTDSVTPNPDALDSVQTTNGNYTAQYGDYIGVHINEQTRSGTNKFHGTMYDYLQNDDLNSKGFNRNTTVPTKNEQRYNIFGGVVDGPVLIPHLYNGRDKTFFTASYEGLRQHSITNAYSQAFTSAEEGGDFSALLNPTLSGASKPTILYSPYTGQSYYNAANNTQKITDQTAANGTIVANILKYAVLCNVCSAPLNANYLQHTPSSTRYNNSLDRIDEVFNDHQRIFGRYAWQYVYGVSTAREYVNNTYNPNDNRNLALGYTWIIKPNLVNDLRGGFNWLKTSELDYFYEYGPNNPDSLLGLASPFGVGQAFGDPGLPDIGGGTSFSESESGENWVQDDRTYQLYDQIAYTRNRHSFLAGVDIRRLMIGRAAVNSARGILSFSSSYTANFTGTTGSGCSATGYSSCNYGSGDASLFLGVMSGDTTPLDQVKEQGFFVQDTWQVGKKLTLDYGFRYELPMVPTSANGYARFLSPNFTTFIPASTATSPTTYTPTPGLALTGPNHHDFGPHLGFAYRWTDRVTIRGGGGIYYNSNQMNAYTLMSSNYPFAASAVYSSPAAGTQSLTNAYSTLAASTTPSANNGGLTAGTGSVPVAPGVQGQASAVTAYTVANPLKSETMDQWNLDAGIELWKNAGLEFQYLGSHSSHLNTNYYPNQPAVGVGNQALSVQLRRPQQDFGQIRAADNIASASYDGLTTVFRQRMTHGVTANLSYTWSHALDESADANSGGSCMIQGDCLADWGNSNFDLRNKVVGSVTWALPKLEHQNIIMQEVAGGWQVNAIETLQTGSPINVTMSVPGNGWANVGDPSQGERPNFVHHYKLHCNKQAILSEPYGTNTVSCADSTAYSAPTEYTYGNLHRNDLYGPGQWFNNISLFKSFKLYGPTSFQLRAEAFNAFNHTNMANPGNLGLTVSAVSSTSTVGTLTPSSPFGTPAVGTTSGINGGRIVQVSGKINF